MDWLQYYDLIKELAGTDFAKQLFIWTSSLSVASFIHSGRVKAEIATQLSSVTFAINSLAEALKKELKNHSVRLEMVEIKVNELNGKVLKLEGE